MVHFGGSAPNLDSAMSYSVILGPDMDAVLQYTIYHHTITIREMAIFPKTTYHHHHAPKIVRYRITILTAQVLDMMVMVRYRTHVW